ncbi:hypothetical protein SUGI_1120050 [Cryptomeria japonica]|nr:hypothetical protein SUGI_1120050 [Cryptomeria japonica]
MPSLCQRTTICVCNAKPISKYSSVISNGPATVASKFNVSRFHHNNIKSGSKMTRSTDAHNRKQEFQQKRKGLLRAVAEEDTQVEEQAVTTSVVSRSDKLTMFFKAEGSLDNKLVPKVTQTLQNLEDVSDVKIETVESITTVELVKQTTIQATGVASGLVEQLQRMGFKLLSLSLRFEDEEEEEEEAQRALLFKELSSQD